MAENRTTNETAEWRKTEQQQNNKRNRRMAENRTTNDQPDKDDRNSKNKGKGKQNYAGLVTDGPVKGITINPGGDQATELKELLKATIVYVPGQPTLKIVRCPTPKTPGVIGVKGKPGVQEVNPGVIGVKGKPGVQEVNPKKPGVKPEVQEINPILGRTINNVKFGSNNNGMLDRDDLYNEAEENIDGYQDLQGNRLNQVIDEVSEAVAYEAEDEEEFEIFGNAGYDFHTKGLGGRLFLKYREPLMGLDHRKHIIQYMTMQRFNDRCLEECVGNNMKLR